MSQKEPQAQKYEFQAEVSQLLNILTHSLYTHRDIYIRELVSNAADALDKVRFKDIKGDEIADPDLNMEIHIDLDEKENTFTISDTGIGMTKEELIQNIGTIARSGTSEFIKQLAEENKGDINLIGRFGIGFYSVFMAGEHVEVTSKSANKEEPAQVWKSDGQGSFEIAEAPEETKRGTSIKVFLREDAKEFAEKFRVENTIKKYSNFVPFPIFLDKEQVNTQSAIWREPKSSVTKEQYNEFFKFIANQHEDALTWLHFSADVPLQFHSLLFVPQNNLEFMGFGREDEGINLFVKRVMVDSRAKDILPPYLRFVNGVIESDDLPLNISRETLQENPYMFKIKNTVVSKFLSFLQDFATNEPQEYEKLWNQHGRVLKEGYNDYPNKDKVAELFRFNSSKCNNADELISLQTYVDRMQENQDEIYFLSGPSREALQSNPNMEIFKAKDIEVFYCFDPIDEFALPGLLEYKNKKIISVDQVDLSKLSSIPSNDKKSKETEAEKPDKKDLDNLARRIKDILGDRVEDVKLSERLVNSPAVLVGTTPGVSSQMEKIMQIYNKDTKAPKKIMEINKNHPMILNLLNIYKRDVKDPILTKVVSSLFNSVQLLDGTVSDPHDMATSMQDVLAETTKLYLDEKTH